MERFRVLCLAAVVTVATAILGPSPPAAAGETAETTVKLTDCAPAATNTAGVYAVSNTGAVHEQLGISEVSIPAAIDKHSAAGMFLATYLMQPYDPYTDRNVAWVKTRDGWRLIERRSGDWPFMLTGWPTGGGDKNDHMVTGGHTKAPPHLRRATYIGVETDKAIADLAKGGATQDHIADPLRR